MITRNLPQRLFDTEFRRLANIVIEPTDHIIPSPIVYQPLQFIMAEKTIASIINKSLEQTKKFSGKAEEDADEWIKDLMSKFNMAELTEPQALKIILNFLDGPAKDWYNENNAQFESWSVFKAEFIRTYSSPATKQLASHRLRTRQQRVDEPIIEYYIDVIKLCKLVDPNMTDASKLDHLCHGLKLSLMREVLRHTPRTPAEFLEYAKQEEVLDSLVNTLFNSTTHEDRRDMYSANSFTSSPQMSVVTSSSRFPTQDVRYSSQPNRQQESSSSSQYSLFKYSTISVVREEMERE
ncbi:unnamed protein product [Adineta steineri]|uniref:Retrotransposon gag domain-containing protein n=1 Tax=Adineta steineri TaxID=433720 RepID=A0A814GVX1_9BILA|nr:unnamed protein product [Adineta steineri]CAF1303351.1 unnamed protein product [Adineta steineri]CAF1304402.1 unnamed protein product [Adineta steineri]